jgi:phosphoglycolate phosphatase-like HAD superfamily hydrolase
MAADRLLLWDIDGTLIRAGPIARLAFDRAVERVLGRAVVDHQIPMSGKTDPQIAREILAAHGVDGPAADAHLPAVIAHLEAELGAAEAALRDGGRVLPGVRELLARLAAHPGVIQSLLTGNTAANAAAKLAAFGLTDHFDLDVAAFGSDHADRTRLVPVALARARARHGFDPDRGVVWVIGDTPFDLACARAGGARCLLVATGRTPRSALEGIGADAVLDDLADVDAVTAIVLA